LKNGVSEVFVQTLDCKICSCPTRMSERNKIGEILIIFRKIKLFLQISLHSKSENQNTLDTRCGGELFLIKESPTRYSFRCRSGPGP